MRTAPQRKQSPPAAAPVVSATPVPAHHTNRHLAAALFAAASGDRITVVTAPPGAGKTFLISHLADQLSQRIGLRVAVAAQTREQAYDVANRIAALGAPTRFLIGKNDPRPRALATEVAAIKAGRAPLNATGGVAVATSARWLHTPSRTYRADILLVDEAYQMTYADLIAIGNLADQYVLVGDPGQIAPVVTGETRRWAHTATGPHLPAPQALNGAHPEAITRVNLDTTHRLGPSTAALVAPLYPTLPFSSARPPSHVTHNGDRLPEYRALDHPVRHDHTDPAVAAAAATTARDLLNSTITTTEGTRSTRPADIAVIAPHVDQAALIAAHLADQPDILVGTINQAQGIERHIVVAVHPLTGHPDCPTFATDLGRLCVTLSRHRSHLSIITDTNTPHYLAEATQEATRAHQEVLTIQSQILTTLHTGK